MYRTNIIYPKTFLELLGEVNPNINCDCLGDDFKESKALLEDVFSGVYEQGDLAGIRESENSLALAFEVWTRHEDMSLFEDSEEVFLGYVGKILKKKISVLKEISHNWKNFTMDIIGYAIIEEISGRNPVNAQLLMYDLIIRKYKKTGNRVETITAEDMIEMFSEMTGIKVPKRWFLNREIGKRILKLSKMYVKANRIFGFNNIGRLEFWDEVPNGKTDPNYPELD